MHFKMMMTAKVVMKKIVPVYRSFWVIGESITLVHCFVQEIKELGPHICLATSCFVLFEHRIHVCEDILIESLLSKVDPREY